MASDAWNEVKGNLTYVRLMATGTVSLAWVLLTNLGQLRKVREVKPSEEHYIRPPRGYDLPEYRPEMARPPSQEG